MVLVPLVTAFLTSLAIGRLILWTRPVHGHVTVDATTGAQKIHVGSIPRIGGLAIGLGLLIGGGWMSLSGSHLWWAFAACALPVFAAGLWEDLAKTASVRTRLLATIAAGTIFSMVTGHALHALGIPGVDAVLAVPLFAVAFTGFAVGGVANALNLIDGCNGLASGTAMLLLATFGLIAWRQSDAALALISLTTLCATAGFFALNFPRGLIFLGDAGAYSVGFLLAALAVALPARNPEVCPVIGLLVLVYPVSETLFTIARRLRRGRRAIGRPDRQHLHSLVFRALRGWIGDRTRRNSASAALLWGLPLISGLCAVALSGAGTGAVLIAAAVNALLYGCAYAAALSQVRRRRPPNPARHPLFPFGATGTPTARRALARLDQPRRAEQRLQVRLGPRTEVADHL